MSLRKNWIGQKSIGTLTPLYIVYKELNEPASVDFAGTLYNFASIIVF